MTLVIKSSTVTDDLCETQPIKFEDRAQVNIGTDDLFFIVKAPKIEVGNDVVFLGNGDEGGDGSHAPNQTAGVPDTHPGVRGIDGASGGNGSNGATILFLCEQFVCENVAFELSGGKGGTGGNGGKGGRGGRADRSQRRRGGDGGAGGNGGKGGEGGDGGYVIVLANEMDARGLASFRATYGAGGKGGSRGVGGDGGPGRGAAGPFGIGAQPGGNPGPRGDRDGLEGQIGKSGIPNWVHFRSIEEVDRLRPDWADFIRMIMNTEAKA